MRYNARVEIANRDQTDAGRLLERLSGYHAAVSLSPRGWLEALITLPAENLAQAASTATAVVENAAGAQALVVEVMTEEEFDARQGDVPLPELLGTAETAALLGVTRQRVQQLAASGALPSVKVGTSLGFPRSAVEATAGSTLTTGEETR